MQNPKEFSEHDHSHCIAGGVEAVRAACAERGLQLTPVRERVLKLLLAEHRALGAYDILEVLRAEGLGSQPPVAYRALDFLVQNGFAHRVERLNAFVACATPTDDHDPAFLICRSCDAVAETGTDAKRDSVGRSAAAAGFQIEGAVVEALGLCPKCQDAD
ncbi:MAG: transcriptional repressor [Pseudomonadota bacterium]